MLPKFMILALVVLVAGMSALFDLSFAEAEQAAPKVPTPPQLTRSDIAAFDAMRAHIQKLWRPPADKTNQEEVVVSVRLSLNPDGTLAGPPRVMTRGTTERYLKARDSAVRAILRAQPFTMLLPMNYELWKEIELTLDPRDPPR